MTRPGRTALAAVTLILFSLTVLALGSAPAAAAPPGRASIVVDARDGRVLHESRADARQQPASLTKMMTLYMTFEAIQRGQLSLDQRIRISPHAARQPASRMGYQAGQRVTVRDLIRASALRSANDAAVALGEAIGGTEARFAEMMTERARRMGMSNTTFRNASGLTAPGHLSTPRDMAVLSRHLLFDFPQYWNVFGRTETVASGRRINNTNRLLRSYQGADGIKTGFTRAAGFNLAASAQRGQRHIIAVYFGGASTAARNAAVARLLDLGFAQAEARVASVPPGLVVTSRMPPPNPRRATEPTAVAMASAAIDAAVAALAPSPAQAATPNPSTLPADTTEARATPMPVPAPNRVSETGGWSIDLGAFPDREQAIATLAVAAFGQIPGLDQAGREVADIGGRGQRHAYAARFTGLDGLTALTACAVLSVEGQRCTPSPPNEEGGR